MRNINIDSKFTLLYKLICIVFICTYFYSCKTTLRGSRPIVLEDKKIDKDSLSADVILQMKDSWTAYKKFAWGRDELKPLSQSFKDYYGESLLFTPLSAYTTLKLMKLDSEALECKELILSQLSFDKDIDVNHAEIVHVVLGGLLSAYEMDGDEKFLRLATELGDKMLPVFKAPYGLVYRNINLKTGIASGEICNPDEIAGLILEYGILSKLTEDPKYFNAAKSAAKTLYSKKSKLNLLGAAIDIRTGLWTNPETHIMEGMDIWYDDLYKSAVMFNDAELMEMFNTSISAVVKYLKEFTNMGTWYELGNMAYGTQVHPEFSAQSCSFPILLANSGDIKEAENMMESVIKYWAEYGIAPEQMNYKTKQVISASYLLRPQAIQSAAVLYRMTSKDRYLKAGDYMYSSMIKFCKNGTNGFAALRDVRTLEKMDQMDYYFYSSTLKYAFLLYNDEVANTLGQYIISTNGMMFRR